MKRHFTILTTALCSLAIVTSSLPAATVVVAPLHDASPGSDADVAQGVTDLVAALLAEQVTVVSSEKLDAALKEQGLSARGLTDAATAVKLGKLLQADFVLTGSVFRRADKIEFAAQLVEVAGGSVVKALAAEGPADKLLETSSALATQCATALKLEPRPAETGQAVAADRLAEERFFLEALGRYHAGDYDRAIMNCLKVIELNPNHEKVRLRLAESFLAAGDEEQARIAFRRTLQLFPALAPEPRILALLERLERPAIQAVEKTVVSVALPASWPADAAVSYELSWHGQPARRDEAKAAAGTLSLEMPGARVPLDLKLVLSTANQTAATQHVRLWPADAMIRKPERKLVVVDPDEEIVGLLQGLEFKHYKSCASLPATDCRLVIAPAAAAKITADQGRALTAFVSSGGQVSILGPAAEGLEIAGVTRATVRWPLAQNWTVRSDVAAWTFLHSQDFIALVSREAEIPALKGGTLWLAIADRPVGLVSESLVGQGRLLWIACPAAFRAADPRMARLVALALSDSPVPPPAK